MTGKKCRPRERGYQKSAFEIYYELGDGRSCAAVAETLGRPKSTIKHWASRFEWWKRVNRRISWRADDKPERTECAQSEGVKRANKFLDAALARMITHLAKGNLRASPQDLMTLHRLEEKLSERVNRSPDNRTKAEQVYIIIPHNNRSRRAERVIPESQLKEYMDYLNNRT